MTHPIAAYKLTELPAFHPKTWKISDEDPQKIICGQRIMAQVPFIKEVEDPYHEMLSRADFIRRACANHQSALYLLKMAVRDGFCSASPAGRRAIQRVINRMQQTEILL